jgi:hypothetical protein
LSSLTTQAQGNDLSKHKDFSTQGGTSGANSHLPTENDLKPGKSEMTYEDMLKAECHYNKPEKSTVNTASILQKKLMQLIRVTFPSRL